MSTTPRTRPSPLVQAFKAALLALEKAAEEVVELCDHNTEIARGLPLEDLAEMTVVLKSGRDAADAAKRRCTAMRDTVNRFFCVRLDATGETIYRTATHTLSPDVEGFYSPPNPKTQPMQFKEFVDAVVADGQDPFVLLHGDGLTEYCAGLLAAGRNVPPNVSKFLNAKVEVRKRTGVLPGFSKPK